MKRTKLSANSKLCLLYNTYKVNISTTREVYIATIMKIVHGVSIANTAAKSQVHVLGPTM